MGLCEKSPALSAGPPAARRRSGSSGQRLVAQWIAALCTRRAFGFTRFMKTLLSCLCLAALLTSPIFAEEKKPATAAPAKAPVGNVVSPDEVAKLVAEKKATVLDIRTPEEFSEGHIPGAVNIDFMDDDFAKKIAALDKSKTYVVHCGAGSRSGKSLPLFDETGFKSVLHLQEGFKGWQSAGKPVEKK